MDARVTRNVVFRDTPSLIGEEVVDVQAPPPTPEAVAEPRAGRDGFSAETYTPGSEQDFDRLCRNSYHRVLYTVLAIVHEGQAGEDCAQEAFLRACEKWHTWKGEAPAEVWLHRIAVNVALSYRRWRKLRQIGEILRRLGGVPRQADSGDMSVRSVLVSELRKLPPQQAAAIVLRHVHGYSNREIAMALGIPESTVASRLAAAKKRLRKELQ